MATHAEVTSYPSPVPSVEFVSATTGEVAGELTPLLGSPARAFLNGEITPEEYFALTEEERAANRRLHDFMQSDQVPDFMPKPSRLSQFRGWLNGILKVM